MAGRYGRNGRFEPIGVRRSPKRPDFATFAPKNRGACDGLAGRVLDELGRQSTMQGASLRRKRPGRSPPHPEESEERQENRQGCQRWIGPFLLRLVFRQPCG